MLERVMSWAVWVVEKIWPGLLIAFVLKLASHTPFYEQHLASLLALVTRYVLGPRLQIRAVGLREDGFSEARFSILGVEIANEPNVTCVPLLNWGLPDRLREKINSVTPCKPLNNGRVYRRFFDRQWELIPEPRRKGAEHQPWGDWAWKLPLNGKARIDVAGLSQWGDCFGTRTDIGERWYRTGTGNPEIDLPLAANEDYYVEVSIGDDKTRIIYAVSYFVIRHQGTMETFELLAATPPAWLPKVEFGRG